MRNGWVMRNGQLAKNKDLWETFSDSDMRIEFRCIPRSENVVAGHRAKMAAEGVDNPPPRQL